MSSLNKNITTSQLYEGLIVKNYKEMCSILNCEPSKTKGSSRTYQIKDWQRYFDFEKSGQKFIITEVYDTPYPTIDARKLKEGLYVKYIELLLIKYLSTCNGHQTKITKGNLYQILGLVNANYGEYRLSKNKHISTVDSKLKEAIKESDISKADIVSFYQRAELKLNKILSTALNSMSKRFLIKYETEYVIKLPVCEGTDEYTLKIADTNQVSNILYAQNYILGVMGYSNITQVMLAGQLQVFNSKTDAYLREKYGWLGFYSQLSIIYMNDIAREIPLKAEEIRRLSSELQRKDLNKIVIKSLNTQAATKFNNTNNKNTFGESNTLYQYNDNYIQAQEALSEYLVNLDTSDNYNTFWKDI